MFKTAVGWSPVTPPDHTLFTWIVAVLVVLLKVHVHVSPGCTVTSTAPAVPVWPVRLGALHDTAPAVKPVWATSARCTDEPAVSTRLSAKSLVPDATVVTDPGDTVIGDVVVVSLMVQPEVWEL